MPSDPREPKNAGIIVRHVPQHDQQTVALVPDEDCLVWYRDGEEAVLEVDGGGRARSPLRGYAIVPLEEWHRRNRWYPMSWIEWVKGAF